MDTPAQQTVGVIGLGSMGMGSALALHEAGFDVIGYDVSAAAREKFSAAGARVAENPAAVAAAAEIIFVVVVNSDQSMRSCSERIRSRQPWPRADWLSNALRWHRATPVRWENGLRKSSSNCLMHQSAAAR